MLSVDRETSLNTFCGTPLYCPPDVHPNQKTAKRQRDTERECGKRPFASKPDGTTRAVSVNVTSTSLDTMPLRKAGLPAPCDCYVCCNLWRSHDGPKPLQTDRSLSTTPRYHLSRISSKLSQLDILSWHAFVQCRCPQIFSRQHSTDLFLF